MSETLISIRDFIRWGSSRFNEEQLVYGHGTDNALDEAISLVLHVLHLPYDMPDTFLDSRLTLAEREKVQEILDQRIIERKPAAYLTGRARFAGLEFIINENVLVPRSPIAELIDNGFAPWIDQRNTHRVLDLCCGSGCIGIAAAHALPAARVDLADISPKAIEVAAANLQLHGLEHQVETICSDLFNGLKGRTYDLIISNPPYVDREDMAALPQEYLWEPRLGLAAGDDGLDIVRRILAQAADHLEPEGVLVVEVGNSEAALMEAYPDLPFMWLEFERGGHGVFLLTREQLPPSGPDQTESTI